MRFCMTGWKQITQWKSQLLEGAAGVFGGDACWQAFRRALCLRLLPYFSADNAIR